MPGTMEVGKANAGPPGAEDPVIDPADDRQHPQENGSLAQAEHLDILLHFQLMHEQEHGWHSKSQQNESIHNLKNIFKEKQAVLYLPTYWLYKPHKSC